MRVRFLMVLVLVLAACAAREPNASADRAVETALAPPGWADARGSFTDSAGSETGEAQFKEAPAGVLFRLDVSGLSPGWHGIHFHQVGDCSDGAEGFKKSGPHVDPGAREHGLLHEGGPEEGDLPNIFAAGDGRARAEIFRAGATLGGEGGLIDQDGFAVIVHANADDHETQPIGGAGDRVACAAVSP